MGLWNLIIGKWLHKFGCLLHPLIFVLSLKFNSKWDWYAIFQQRTCSALFILIFNNIFYCFLLDVRLILNQGQTFVPIEVFKSCIMIFNIIQDVILKPPGENHYPPWVTPPAPFWVFVHHKRYICTWWTSNCV